MDSSPRAPRTVAVSSRARLKAWASGESRVAVMLVSPSRVSASSQTPRCSAAACGLLLGEVGLVADDRGLHAPGDPGERDPVGELGELVVDEARGGCLEGDGLLGDPAGLPHREPPGHDLGPQPGEPVAQLDGLGDVGPCGVLGQLQGDGEVGDRELPDAEGALAGQAQDAFGAELAGLVGQLGGLGGVVVEVPDHVAALTRQRAAGQPLGLGDPVPVGVGSDRAQLGDLGPTHHDPVLRDRREHGLVVQTEHVDLTTPHTLIGEVAGCGAWCVVAMTRTYGRPPTFSGPDPQAGMGNSREFPWRLWVVSTGARFASMLDHRHSLRWLVASASSHLTSPVSGLAQVARSSIDHLAERPRRSTGDRPQENSMIWRRAVPAASSSMARLTSSSAMREDTRASTGSRPSRHHWANTGMSRVGTADPR